MNNHPFSDDQAWSLLKSHLVELAQQHIANRFNQVGYELKADGSLLTEADTAMQKHTTEWLKSQWPQIAILGEESNPEEQQAALNQSYCWIIDPIDGTTNFANGVPFFSVSLALMVKGEIVAGLVYDPARDELFAARKGLGAELNHQPIQPPTNPTEELKRCVGVIDFKRLKPKLATALATQAPYASQRSFGSVALDWCWIACGRGQLYLHGNQSLWDYAAGWLILNESQGASCNLDGESVFKRQVAKQSAIAATNPALLKKWFDWIQQHS